MSVDSELLTDWQAVARGHQARAGDAASDPAYLEFRRRLAQAYGPVAELLAVRRRGPLAPRLGPLPASPLGAAEVSLPAAEVTGLLRQLPELLASQGGGGRELERIVAAVDRDGELPTRLIRWAVWEWDGPAIRRAAQELGVSYGGLLMVGRLLAVPFLQEAVAAARPRRIESFGGGGNCPNCGSPPMLARLEGKEGRRFLLCGLCDTQWLFPRVRCPFCENNARESLVTLTAEGLDGMHLEACESCRRYIKTVVSPEGQPPLHPFVAETLSLPLDLIAPNHRFVHRLF